METRIARGQCHYCPPKKKKILIENDDCAASQKRHNEEHRKRIFLSLSYLRLYYFVFASVPFWLEYHGLL